MLCLPPTLKLRIHNERDFYVEGDTLCGEVQLKASSKCVVHSLRAEITCTEHTNLPPWGVDTMTRCTREVDLLLGKQVDGIGRHSYAFSLSIPENDGEHAPSFDVVEAPGCGIRWCVKATAKVEISKKRKTLEHSHLVRVFLVPSERELQDFGVETSGQLTAESITCWRSWPRYLPQRPNFCNLRLRVTLAEPALVRHVKVYIETGIVMWVETESKVFLRRELLGTVSVNKVLRELELDDVSRRWQLKKILTPPFSTGSFCLHYNTRVEVMLKDKVPATFTWLDKPISSPALVRAVEKAEEHRTARDGAPPPPYS